MIYLRRFDKGDISLLREHMFSDSTDKEILKVIESWNTLTYNGKYFEMFAIGQNETVVGSISLYQRDNTTVSIGPTIFPASRRMGYASLAMKKVLTYAKSQGYKTATAQIRKTNTASIRLHENLGFVFKSEAVNRNGHEVFIYSKAL